MASRLASRLKPHSNKKSPGTSRSNTPTQSQSSVNPKPQEDPSIDEVLTGPDIESLRIKEKDFEKLHESYQSLSTETTPTKQLQPVVVVKDQIISEDQSKKKSVAVLYPLPAGVKPKKTKLLGSAEAGPRFDEEKVFLSHSILGTVDEFVTAEKSASSKPFNVKRVPPPVLPEIPKKILEKNKSLPSPRETNALASWDNQMKERKLLQESITRRIKSSNQLAMNHGDSYRNTQEQRTVIDRAIPSIDKGKGFYVGSEFWRPQMRIGDDMTGIRTTLTSTEKGHPPDIELVKTPASIKKAQGVSEVRRPLCHTWKRSGYLRTRKSELQEAIRDVSFSPPTDMSMLQVMGHTPRHDPREATGSKHRLSSTPSFLHTSVSLDSLGEETFQDNDNEEEDEGNSLLQSTSILDVHPDVVTPPVVGPALKLNEQLLKWEGESSPALEGSGGKDNIEVRVLFETDALKEPVSSRLSLQNIGTTSLYFNWKKVYRPNPLGTALQGRTQRFYFDTKAGVLSPGESLTFSFVFKSSSPGIYTETWCLETNPVLCGGRQVMVILRGVAFKPDVLKAKKEEIERKLMNRVAESSSRRLIDKIVDTIQTPIRVKSPLPIKTTEEEEFLAKNIGLKVSYNYNAVQLLKKVHREILHPESTEKEPTGKAAGKKGDDKGKKAGKDKKEGGKGGKQPPSHGETPKESQTDISHRPTEEDIPAWNLSINQLQEMVLGVEDDDRREGFLTRLNAAMSALMMPPPQLRGANSYTTIYSLLCEAVDEIAENGSRLHNIMGLPSRYVGLKGDETSSEQESQSAESPVLGKKEQGKKGKGKDKDTSKERPTSKQKGKISRKGSFKTAAKQVIAISKASSPEPDQPGEGMVVEVDPILNAKYKQNLYSMVYYILKCSVQQLDDLLSLERTEN